MDNLMREIMRSVETSFIDTDHLSADELRPKLIYNDTKKGNTVLANIDKELGFVGTCPSRQKLKKLQFRSDF